MDTIKEHAQEHAHTKHSSYLTIVIAILAAIIAIAELGVNTTQTSLNTTNIELADTWNWYQAKDTRAKGLSTMIELLSIVKVDDAHSSERDDLLSEWNTQLTKYDTNGIDSLIKLRDHAKIIETERDRLTERLHHFETSVTVAEMGLCVVTVAVSIEIPLALIMVYLFGMVGAAQCVLGLFT